MAREAGIRPSAIRFYEEAGHLSEPQRVGGQRRHERDVLIRPAVMRMAQEAGFMIEEIHTPLTGFAEGTPASARCQELAHRKLPEVDARITRLQAVRTVLEGALRHGETIFGDLLAKALPARRRRSSLTTSRLQT